MATQLKKKYIGNDQIDGDKIKLLPGQTLRKDDGAGGSIDVIAVLETATAQVQSNLTQEISDRASQDSALSQEIQDEVTRATGAESALGSDIASEEARALGQEAAIRSEFAAADDLKVSKAGDIMTGTLDFSGAQTAIFAQFGDGVDIVETTSLSEDMIWMNYHDNVNNESYNAQLNTGYLRLNSTIEGVFKEIKLDAVTGHILAQVDGEPMLSSDPSSLTTKKYVDDADAGLQSQIDAISGGGSGSLSALQAELDATQLGAGLNYDGSFTNSPGTNYTGSATSLKSAVEILDVAIKGVSDSLNQEVSDRQSAVSGVQSQIDAIMQGASGSLDSFVEVVQAFEQADQNLNNAITSLASAASSGLTTETAARIASDSALQGEIDAEEAARAAGDVTLANSITSEASARSAQDIILQSNIDDLDGYAQVIRSDLDQEVLDRTSVVSAEASARASADTALSGRVSVLESVVWFKEKFLISNGQTSVSLSHTPEANSVTAFVDRLAIHQGASEDYTITGSTMTFLNDLVSPGQSQLGNGDTVYVKYQYKV